MNAFQEAPSGVAQEQISCLSPTPSDKSDNLEGVAALVVKRPTTSAASKKRAAKAKKKKITINTTCCKYEIVRHCSVASGLRVVDDSEPWSIFWIDTGVSVQRVLEMEPYQKINHFPGMQEICRKDYLARNLGRLSRLLPKEYNFFPKTYVLPHDWADLKIAIKAKKHQTYIAKPDHGCQGKGIFLFRSLKAITPLKEQRMIVQMYLNKPCLIDHFKFDLRVYVLVTSVNPLRIFVHRDGLARFATERYVDPSESNLNDVCMHLTNYAINKHSSNFDFTESEDAGSKRTIESVFNRLLQRGSIKDPEDLWKRIHDAIVKTCITVQPQLAMILRACFPGNRVVSSGRSVAPTASGSAPVVESIPSGKKFKEYTGSQCFEILGFDIFLDKKLKPWVLEVNHSPSFTCDSPLDLEVKRKVIGDTFGILNLNAMTRKKFEKVEKEKIKSRLFGNAAPSVVATDSFALKSADHDSKQNSASAQMAKKPPLSATVSNSLRKDSAPPSPNRTISKASSTISISSAKPLTASANALHQPTLNQSAQELIDEYYGTYPPALLESLQTYEDAHIGSFSRVFPPPDTNPTLLAKYLKCLASAKRLSPDTAATKGRKEHLQKLAQEKELELKKMEKWKAAVNEKGVVRDGSGVVKKVTSKFMSWRTEQQLAIEREEKYRSSLIDDNSQELESECASEFPEENAYKPPLVLSQQQHQINMAYDLPDQMIVKHIQGKPIVLQPSNPPSRSASAHKFKHPTRYRENTTNNKNPSLALSTQNIEIINTWLKEEGKSSQPTQKRTTTRPLPKHLHKHLPFSNLNKQAGSGSGGGTSYSNTMFSKSVAASSSNTEFFPVRQTLAQRNAILRKTKEAAAAAMLNNIQTQDIPTCAFDLTPMEQLEKAVDSARPYNMHAKGAGAAGGGEIKIEGFVGRSRAPPHSAVPRNLPGYIS